MSYAICSRFKGEHIVYAGYTICTSREHIVYGAFCGSTMRMHSSLHCSHINDVIALMVHGRADMGAREGQYGFT